MRMLLRLGVAGLAMMGVAAPAAVTFDTVATGFVQATAVTQNARAGETRLFVATKDGLIESLDRRTSARATLLDLRGTLVTAGEQGLIGLTFDPNYASNGHYYVHVQARAEPSAPVFTEVRRYTDTTVAAAAAPLTLLRFQQTEFSNHKGGWIGFDRGGMLMIAVGDGGGAFDPLATGQNPSDLFGAILRVDPSRDAFPNDPARNYAIPEGNAAVTGAADEVFAYGVRNPFANSIAPDGNLIVADVGQGEREELTIVAPGSANRNLGWRLREGDIATPLVGGPEPADHVDPAYVYDHSAGDQSIIGGFVYRGSAVPELMGRYVFGDQVSGRVWSIAYDGDGFDAASRLELGTFSSLVAFGETPEGEILLTQFRFDSGRVIQLGSDSPAVPEPASWAMLIAGFGLIGATLRRRSPGAGVCAAA